MDWQWLWITADDVWRFRDGKPFFAGEHHTARSMFPPTPYTIQGALRAYLLGHSSVDWQNAEQLETIGRTDLTDMGPFSIAGPFVGYYEDGTYHRLLTFPADMMVGKNGEIRQRTPDPEHIPQWNMGGDKQNKTKELAPLVFKPHIEPSKVPSFWLKESYLAHLWNNASNTLSHVGKLGARKAVVSEAEPKSIWDSEYRIGIKMDYTVGRPEDQMLYRVEHIRLHAGFGLLVGVNPALGFPESGILALGGDGHAATFQTVTNDVVLSDWPQPSNRLKIVFLTPTFFQGGATPAMWEAFFGVPVRLVSYALHQPIAIGGWDYQKGAERDLHYYIAPGSVYYLEADEPCLPIKEAITDRPSGLDASALGFGQFILGTW